MSRQERAIQDFMHNCLVMRKEEQIIDHILAEQGKYYDADRVTVFGVDEAYTRVRKLWQWCAEGAKNPAGYPGGWAYAMADVAFGTGRVLPLRRVPEQPISPGGRHAAEVPQNRLPDGVSDSGERKNDRLISHTMFWRKTGLCLIGYAQWTE